MTFALQNALLFPERHDGVQEGLDLTMGMELSFSPPDMERYPCLKLAIDALIQGGSAPLVFNAANEIAVDAFLANRIGFAQISNIIDHTLTLFEHRTFQSLNDLLTLDNEARILAEQGIVQVA